MINNNWVFGKNCSLDFSTNPPTPGSNSSITSGEGCASISDDNGNLLFYTDGETIWDGTHTIQPIPLLGGNSSTQSSIIIPDPGNNKKYYVFTTGDNLGNAQEHFNGVLIDINNWSYSPLSNLMALPNTSGYTPTEKLTAIQHENCKDFWVITLVQTNEDFHRLGDGVLRVFLVDSSGVQHISDTLLNQKTNDVGYMKASPNGNNLAILSHGVFKILVYPFNKSTGTINLTSIMPINTYTDNHYSLEFSPDSTLLYFNDPIAGHIYQVNLVGSLVPVIVGNVYRAGALQLGKYKRIYITKIGQNSMAAILKPNIQGTGCDIDNSFISFPRGSQCIQGLPNLFSKVCESDSENGCECGCSSCNENSEKQNEELKERALKKFNVYNSINSTCDKPYSEKACEQTIINPKIEVKPCFYFHWGEGPYDQIEEHDTEIIYLTICNNYKDVLFKGLKITKISLNPNIHSIKEIQIVPDRFINLDCLEPCTCQTREFAIINRANDTAGYYTLEVEYCYEDIVIAKSGNHGVAKFKILITDD